jgi:hypothetical protein
LFEQMVEGLAGGEAGLLRHGELEERLSVSGRELLRSLFQDHVDLRAAREVRCGGVVGADGVERTRVESGRSRQLATVVGQVTVSRMAYRAPGVSNLYPADAVLDLPAVKHSHGLAKLAAVESARGSFEQAVQAIERATGVTVGKRQLQGLVRSAAVDAGAFYTARTPGPSPEDLLALSFDGKGVVMRPEALREATRKAAAGQNKLATRLSPGEKTGRKRMAEVGAVYDAAPVPRTAADVIGRPGGRGGQTHRDRPRRRGPAATGKWLTASLTDDIPEVVKAGFDEAERRDPAHQRTWVCLLDGNRQQIDAVTAEAAHRGVSVHILIDFIHVLEYLWKAAWSFFIPGDHDAEAWVADQAAKVLAGKAADVAAGIRRRATRYGYTATERKGADTAADYLTAKNPYLDYATALAQGWPIATGIIEGACRHLVKDRMDITGARWGLHGAEAVLTLRAIIANGDLDDYWTFHLQQEHHRVHHTRYHSDHALAA